MQQEERQKRAMEVNSAGSVKKLTAMFDGIESNKDIMVMKRSALGRQANLPVAVAAVPQPATTVGQGDQLAEHLKQEAKGKMTALVNKLKNNCDGIRQDARADG